MNERMNKGRINLKKKKKEAVSASKTDWHINNYAIVWRSISEMGISKKKKASHLPGKEGFSLWT